MMYKFANERNRIFDLVSTNCEIKFSKRYVNSCSCILRTLIAIIGMICIVLISIGYEHDLKQEIPEITLIKTDSNISEVIYSSYGMGYKAEVLTQFFLAAVIICFGFSVVYLVFLLFVRKASSDWRTANKSVHIILGLYLLTGTICGGFGVEYFKENCCRVNSRFSRDGINYEYLNISDGGYDMWCLCTLKTNQSLTLTSYQWNANYVGKHITSASPHHQTIHAFSIFMAFINCIMYIAAFFFP